MTPYPVNELFEKLSTTRQLTEYRDWPGGRKGCLFYVPFPDNYEYSHGAICLIDNPWRKDDKTGSHNQLHQQEWDLAELNIVLYGYGAFLIQWGWATDYKKGVDEAWKVYEEWVGGSLPEEQDDVMEFLADECYKWQKRQNAILQEYHRSNTFEGGSLYELFDATIRHLVKQVSNNMTTMMWNIEPYLGYYPRLSDTDCHRIYNPQLETIIPHNKDGYEELSGVCATITNYLAVFYVFDNIKHDLKFEVTPEEWICNAFNLYEQGIRHTITYNEVLNYYDGPDIQAMLDCYKKEKEKLVVAELKKDIDYLACRSEEAKRTLTIQTMFEAEKGCYPDFDEQEYAYLSDDARSYLRNIYISYMLDLLDVLKDSQYYDEDRSYLLDRFPKELEILFGDSIKNKLRSSRIFTKKAKQENKIEQIIQALQQSFVNRHDKARALVEEIRAWQKEGYMENYNASIMHDELKDIINGNFGYSGFRKYYNG